MNGDIWVDSTLGRGSTIYFTALLSTTPIGALPKVEHCAGLNPLRVLLVEDSHDNSLLIQHYMKTTPHILDIAVNGKEAVEKAKTGLYDLIFMDIQMPVMDGYDATKEIRCWEETNTRQPVLIVALTAYAMAEEVQKMLANGFNLHLSKPIKKATLLNLVNKYARCTVG
jgi:CheY-like chemotaxis protein